MTWSDRLPPERRRSLGARLLSVVPAPRPYARGARTPLRAARSPTPGQLASLLRERPRFAWLDGEAFGHRLYAEPLAVLSARGGRATVQGPGGRASFRAGGFELLAAAFEAWGAAGPGATLVGYLGYELAGELEELPPPPEDDLGLPDLHLALYDRGLRPDGHGWLLESTDAWHCEGDPVIEAERWLAEAGKLPEPEPPGRPPASGAAASRPHRPGYEAAVARALERIRQGEIFQVNLCRRLEAPLPPDQLWPLYLRLRSASPASHGALLDLGAERHRARGVLSVSPERFLSVREGIVETWPIKGTRPRGRDAREDRALARELLESEKDRAELTMIVDVARNDLGRACTPGSVEVTRHAELATLPTVHHTVSAVRGRLGEGVGPVELLRAAFPPASITGAPKIQAMKVIAAEEERRRGPAMGALGWISLGGDLELSVAIRTAAAGRGRVAYTAGCGIVADSDPEDEFAESSVKARAFLDALGAREVG